MKVEFRKKPRGLGGSSFGYGMPSVDLSSLLYVPYDTADQTTWLIPNKPLRAAEGIRSDKDIVAAGDIIARSTNAVVFAATEQPTGGSQYLYQMLDVNITNPVNGAMLVYEAASQKWEDVDEFIIEGGQYSII